ncbi:MAG: hypothetical protein U0174_00455 [Polyangiaceae bacterium]
MKTGSWRLGAVLAATCFAAVLSVSEEHAALAFQAPSATSAPAAVSTNTEIMVMHATQEATGSIDARIGSMPQLTKPPFSAYNTYKLLDKKTIAVEKSKSSSYLLPNGRTLEIRVEPLANKTYRVVASISRPEGGAYLKLLEVTAPLNEPFFVGGQTYNKGSLVVAITVRP